MPLTDLQLRRLKPRERTFRKSDGRGLFIEIRPNGKKYWRFAFRLGDKQKLMGIGTYPDVRLVEARAIRDRARADLRAGNDPILERRREKLKAAAAASNTFEALARAWWETKRGEWTEEHARLVWRWIERDLLPSLGARQLPEIEPMDVLATIKAIEKRGALDVARRHRARCAAIFRYAIQTGRCRFNPAADLAGVIKSERVKHRPAMSREALGPFLRQLDEFDRIKPITKLALRLLIQTFVRPGELRGARWDEFDTDASLWRIPAERMKMNEEHIVPLSLQAVETVREVKKYSWASPCLFPSDRSFHRPMSENALPYAMHRMGYKGIATPHGFRATASTILNETGFNPDVIEKALAHEERNKVRKAYNRALYLDERRKMMQWWGDYLDSVRVGGDVVPIRGGRHE